MKTLGLREAAAFLRMHHEELRARAKRGEIPGAKAGRAWVFVEDDLIAYLRSLYPRPRQALQVTLRREVECHFASVGVSGTLTSSSPEPENDYAALLELPIKP